MFNSAQGKTAIVWSCTHDRPEVSKKRFEWLGKLIEDIKPDYTVDLGDGPEMASLNSFDTRYPAKMIGQNYGEDIDSYNEAQEVLWGRFKKKKKKRPMRIGFQGNHEYRIDRAIALDPRLEAKGGKYGVSLSHLNTNKHFDEYHPYENGGPKIAVYDGVAYAHFFSSGNMGTAMSGIHHAAGLINLLGYSATCGHSHKRDFKAKDGAGLYGKGLNGLVVGCYKGAAETWAGQSNKDWWKGVVIKRNIDGGSYDPQFVSLEALEAEYGQ